VCLWGWGGWFFVLPFFGVLFTTYFKFFRTRASKDVETPLRARGIPSFFGPVGLQRTPLPPPSLLFL
jgi:hypothetical protein